MHALIVPSPTLISKILNYEHNILFSLLWLFKSLNLHPVREFSPLFPYKFSLTDAVFCEMEEKFRERKEKFCAHISSHSNVESVKPIFKFSLR